MMALELKDVEKIANLAKLSVPKADAAGLVKDLSNILDLVAQMDQVDTDQVEPMSHPLDMVQRLRPDLVLEKDQREKFQSIAPEVEDGLYLVPQVIG